MGGERLELVRRGGEAEPGDGRDLVGDPLGEAGGCVQAGADGGAALGELHQHRQGLLDAHDAVLDLLGVAGELLAEGDRGRVLGVGAADLDDVLPRLRLVVQRVAELLQGRDQAVDDLLASGDVHRRREAVVRRLAHIDVIVGVDRLLRAHDAAEKLDGAVGDHLVGVHVRLGAGAGLPDDEREVRVELALDHLVGGPDDRLADLRVEAAEVHVHLGGGALDDAETADDRLGHAFAADREILDRTLGLRAPIAVGRNLDRAEAVGLACGWRPWRMPPAGNAIACPSRKYRLAQMRWRNCRPVTSFSGRRRD